MTAHDSYRFAERGTKHVFIWFGGLVEPFVSNERLDELGITSLNVLDRRLDWYTKGIEDVTETDAETVDWLKTMLSGRPVICAGQSSGGYAAIRYGHALDADLIVAMAPQTGVRAPNRPAHPLIALDQLYQAEPKLHPISIHLSRSESVSASSGYWNDHLHAQALATVAEVTIHQHPYDQHAVSMYLHRHGSFLDVVKHDMVWHRIDTSR